MKRIVTIALLLCSASLLFSEELAEGRIDLITASFRRISVLRDGSVTTCADSQGKFTFYKPAGSVDYDDLRIKIKEELAGLSEAGSTSRTMVAIKGGSYAFLRSDSFLRTLFKNDPKEWKLLANSSGGLKQRRQYDGLSDEAVKYLARFPIFALELGHKRTSVN